MSGLRILAALHLYSPHHNAGAETMLHAMLKALVDRGHQVVVQLSMPHPMFRTDPYVYGGVSVYPYERPDGLWRWTHGEPRPHVIVSHLDTALQATMISQLTGIPVVHVVHNTLLPTKRLIARQPALAVYNTHWAQADIEDWLTDWGAPLPPAIVVHPPIDVETYRTTPAKQGGAITLINLTEPKGAEVFYALAERLPKRRFVGVCGAYGHQIIRRDLPNVEILPHVAAHDMPASVYSRTRVLLAPSSYESYGRVVVEAACSGIPSIAHPTPGLVEALGDAGIFRDREDLDAWEAELRRLGTPAAWSGASAMARRVPERLDTDADLRRWAEAVEAVGARPSRLSA